LIIVVYSTIFRQICNSTTTHRTTSAKQGKWTTLWKTLRNAA